MRRYDGNTGRYIHVPDEVIRFPHSQEREVPSVQRKESRGEQSERQKAMPPPNQFGSGLQNIVSNIFAQGFEVEDLLLFAVLFLMYQETKDKELLIIMGGMFLL